MASKTITIREEIYKLLISVKREEESFSDLLERLAKNVDSIELLKMMSKSLDLGDTTNLINEIRESRRNWR